jgi:hypothetical protein
MSLAARLREKCKRGLVKPKEFVNRETTDFPSLDNLEILNVINIAGVLALSAGDLSDSP